MTQRTRGNLVIWIVGSILGGVLTDQWLAVTVGAAAGVVLGSVLSGALGWRQEV